MIKSISSENDAYAALKIKDFRLFIMARFALTFAIQMQSVIIGWQVYSITKDPLSLGLIGLAEAIPFLSIALYAGHVADTVNRRKIILISVSVYFVGAICLLLLSSDLSFLLRTFRIFPIYAVIFCTGLARGFFYPAQSALMAQLVPRKLYANSSTWNSTFYEIAAVSGPAIGGLIYGFAGINFAYLTVIVFVALSLLCFSRMASKPLPVTNKNETLMQNLAAGLKFVFSHQIVLAALSLDMFAVLFGGAVSLLPIFAMDILKTGPQGLGILRAAPAIGSVLMAFFLAYHPPLRKAGHNLLIAVCGFGVSIILFALSRNFILSFLLLAMSGMFDDVSVIIRATIIQLFTPDEMRGRVASVNSIFIGSSNEIGSFESGLAAKLLRVVPSVIFGGMMTLIVVASTYKLAPKLRNLNLLNK